MSESEIKFAEITNAKIAYKTFGSGSPLIMCTGFSSNLDFWSTKLIELLQQKYEIIVFDYRGMGNSTNTDNSFTINTLADDVNELIDTMGIKTIAVLGWSMGSFVAQMFAINHPEKVSKLILYAANCGGKITVDPSDEIVEILSNPASTPMQFLSTLFPDKWLANNPEPWKCMPPTKGPLNPETIGLQYLAIQKWLSPDGGSFQYLKELKMPVLIICGEDDKVVPPQNASILAETIKTSTLIIVKGTGHGLMFQEPELFAEKIISFLDI